MKLILIDNYDSFVYNLYQYLCELGAKVDVFRNDDVPEDLSKYSGIVISPGPGRPENSGRCLKVVEKYVDKKPILGICLGHQIIGYVFGAKIRNAKSIMHGKISKIKHDGKGVFQGVSNPTYATRYHSLVIDNLPEGFIISAMSNEDGEIMAIRHISLPIEGVQFHPESVMTYEGKKMLENFLEVCKNFR